MQSYRKSLFSKTNRTNRSVYKIIIKMFLQQHYSNIESWIDNLVT